MKKESSSKCVLCNSKDIKLLEKLNVKDIASIYKIGFGFKPSQLKKNTELQLMQCNKCKIKYFNPMIVGDDKFYNKLQKYNWYYLSDKYEYDYASNFVGKSDVVLDVGCGSGQFAEKINPKRYVGLEYSRKAIEDANKDNLEVYSESIEIHSRKHPKFYDVVCAFQVLEHVPNPRDFIKSCIRTLKKNGKLIFSIPNDETFVGITANAVLNMPPHHQTRWCTKTMQLIAEEFNIKLLDINYEPLSDLHKTWYLRVIVANAICKRLGISAKSVDTRKGYFLINSISHALATLLLPGLEEVSDAIKGHSLTVVYEKK